MDLHSGTDTILPGGDALFGYVIAAEPDGVYGAPGPLDLVRVDWQGRQTHIATGYFGTTVTVAGDQVAFASKDNGSVHTIDRIDVSTGGTQTWFRSLSRNLSIAGLDPLGQPLILGVAADGSASIWDATTASTSVEPSAKPLGSFSQDPGTLTSVPGQGGFWFESAVIGLFHNDVAVPNSFGQASTHAGFIAGICT